MNACPSSMFPRLLQTTVRAGSPQVGVSRVLPRCQAGEPHRCPASRSGMVMGILFLLTHLCVLASEPSTWWSFQPMSRPEVPQSGSTNVVDAFIEARLRQAGLKPAPEADRRTLARRVSFDLTGLPPTSAELEAFLKDHRLGAYERMVDRLLASPRYGERWARHWMDVAHYGDTHGYDKDKPRPHAWPYRDYLVRAFNQDKPFVRFVQEQLAGDVLFPGTRDGIEALGFVAAGPWDFIGHEEVPETKIDGRVARHLDRDDMVVNTIQTFTSLTIQCAQCHNHKFDPITQEDYYSLQAVFAAVDRTNRRYDPDPGIAGKRNDLGARLYTVQTNLAAIEADWLQAFGGPQRLGDLEQLIKLRTQDPNDQASGYHSAIQTTAGSGAWVQVDLGKTQEIRSVILHPCADDFNGIGAGFGFPVRYRVEVSNDPAFTNAVVLVADRTAADQPNPGNSPVNLKVESAVYGRYVRLTATQLAARKGDFILALAEMEVVNSHGWNRALGASVTSADSIEAGPRWRRSNLTDGGWVGGPTLAELKARRRSLLYAGAPSWVPARVLSLEAEESRLKAELQALPEQHQVYAIGIHTGTGAFQGTGGMGGRPRPIHVLSRGNVQKAGREVGPGAIKSVGIEPARFVVDPQAPEGTRRVALAQWLTHPAHPQTWRSIVNRVWQWHFGRGLVETTGDFGKMGAQPTHPELLDLLSCEFRDSGGSFKALHRLLVTSRTYRQSSSIAPGSEGVRVDPDNRLWWRMNRRRMEAEEYRDSLLQFAGRLDLAMGGPGFEDFVVEKPEHSPHYEYLLHDPEDPRTHRRSVYRFLVRSQPQPLMGALDCADPSMQVWRRAEGISPLQALALLNDGLVLSMSSHAASRFQSGHTGIHEAVRRLWLEALGRPPTSVEAGDLEQLVRLHGMPAACRVVLNLNEFVFVD